MPDLSYHYTRRKRFIDESIAINEPKRLQEASPSEVKQHAKQQGERMRRRVQQLKADLASAEADLAAWESIGSVNRSNP